MSQLLKNVSLSGTVESFLCGSVRYYRLRYALNIVVVVKIKFTSSFVPTQSPLQQAVVFSPFLHC